MCLYIVIIFSSLISDSPFQEDLTQWLRMALQTNPGKRGGQVDDPSGDALCLVTMDNLLRTMVSDEGKGKSEKEREREKEMHMGRVEKTFPLGYAV